jgi:hypothetical protein
MGKLNARLLNWASILDPPTKEQALSTSSMPFIYRHLALMADAHGSLALPHRARAAGWGQPGRGSVQR